MNASTSLMYPAFTIAEVVAWLETVQRMEITPHAVLSNFLWTRAGVAHMIDTADNMLTVYANGGASEARLCGDEEILIVAFLDELPGRSMMAPDLIHGFVLLQRVERKDVTTLVSLLEARRTLEVAREDLVGRRHAHVEAIVSLRDGEKALAGGGISHTMSVLAMIKRQLTTYRKQELAAVRAVADAGITFLRASEDRDRAEAAFTAIQS